MSAPPRPVAGGPSPPPSELLAELLTDMLGRRWVAGDRALFARTLTLLGQLRDEGHVCADLREFCGRAPTDAGPAWPTLAAWRQELLATGLVARDGDGGPPRPLVLDGHDRLYALRHFRAERTIAAFVRARLAAPARVDATALRAALAALDLLPARALAAPDWQLAAVAAATWRPFAVVCGGPGTGKTTTVAKLLSVLLCTAPTLRVAITAPTGKAAARLGEALQQRCAEQPRRAPMLPQLEPSTLHRLLGYLPLDDRFRHGPDRPLVHDLVVVDEASMIDPALLAQLCTALRADARLVLVGDKDQLAAVAAGQVLGDLCRTANPERGVGAGLAQYVAAATGMQLPVQPGAAPLADVTVALRENHRFGSQPGIGAFATALMQRDALLARQSLAAGHADLVHAGDAEAALAALEPALLAMLDAADAGDAEAALAAIARARVLTAQRHGPTGAAAWNRRVELRLAQLGRRTDLPNYVGRPVLVTSNDHQAQIWNGDLGVTGRDARGNPVVWLRDPHGRPRALSPRRLPAHETAWAMTVHKAQGSEFDEVLLVLPERPGPLWHASLVYTGVTRARRRAIVLAAPDLLAQGLAQWPLRTSGLADALAR